MFLVKKYQRFIQKRKQNLAPFIGLKKCGQSWGCGYECVGGWFICVSSFVFISVCATLCLFLCYSLPWGLNIYHIIPRFQLQMICSWDDERAHPLRHPKCEQECSRRWRSFKLSPNVGVGFKKTMEFWWTLVFIY